MSVKGEKIREMLLKGYNYGEISREVGVASSTIAYHAQRLGLRQRTFERKTHDWPEIQKFYDEGHTVSEVVERFGLCWSLITDAKRRKDFILADTNCPERKLALALKRREMQENGRKRTREAEISTVLMRDSRHSTGVVRRIVVRNELLPYFCSNEKCQLHGSPAVWAGEEIVLHLDHVNGVRNDHRIENLRWLCPNCHSQTKTYCGRNKK